MKKFLAQSYLWFVLILMYAPIFFIIVFSFTEAKSLGNWTGFTTQLYENLFTAHGSKVQNLLSALGTTLLIALVSSVVATFLGTVAAIGIFNMRGKKKKTIQFLNNIPMINPDIITGVSLFLLFTMLPISQGYATVILAHISFCTPYVVLNVLPKLSQMNPNIYEAALDLGSTPWQALWKVLVPELRPGMISGFVLAFVMSLDDFAVTFFTRGSVGLETLSTFIYTDSRKGGLTPELKPLMTMIFVLILIALIAVNVKTIKKNEDK